MDGMSTATAPAPVFEVFEDPPVLHAWADGSVRVGGTRLQLDRIVVGHKMGLTPEEIADAFGQRPVAEIYAVLAYYFAHTQQVEEYLARRAEQGERNMAEAKRRWPQDGLKERLLKRKAELDAAAAKQTEVGLGTFTSAESDAADSD